MKPLLQALFVWASQPEQCINRAKRPNDNAFPSKHRRFPAKLKCEAEMQALRTRREACPFMKKILKLNDLLKPLEANAGERLDDIGGS